MNDRVLVTGGTGFIGKHVIAELLRLGYEVTVVSRKQNDQSQVSSETQVNYRNCDLFSATKVAELLVDIQPTHLLHLAWDVEHGKFWTADSNLEWVKASLSLLQYFVENGGRRVVMAGSCAEYDWSYGYCVEDITPIKPDTLYGKAKAALSTILSAYCRQHSVSWAWGRIFHLYGPCESPNRFVPSVTRCMLNNEEVNISQGGKIRDFMHVVDVAGAFANLLNSNVEGDINIANGDPVRLSEVVDILREITGFQGKVNHGAVKPSSFDPDVLFGSSKKLNQRVGFRNRFNLVDGLTDFVHWQTRSNI